MCPEKEEVLSAEQFLARLLVWDQCDSAAWDKLYHRSLFETLRFPLGKYYEDVAVCYLLVEKAGQVAMLPRRIYNYRHRKNSITVAPLNQRTFHFEEHTETVCPYIEDHFPGLRQQAEFLRVRALRYSVLTGELSSREDRQKFRTQLQKSRKALRGHTKFLLTSSLIPRNERIQDLTLAWGLYGLIHGLRHGNR